MKYNGVDYNEKWVLKLSLDEFLKHPCNKRTSNDHLTNIWHLIHDKNVVMNNGKSQQGNYKPQPHDERGWQPK